MKKKYKILVLSNVLESIFLFRKELVEKLINDNYEVYIATPRGDEHKLTFLQQIGAEYVSCQFDRTSTNIMDDIRLLVKYFKLVKEIRPDCILNYTIKPCIYGGIVATLLRVPYINTVTGISPVLEVGKGFVFRLVTFLCRLGYRKSSFVFFQNQRNRELFERLKIKGKEAILVNGSGVNLEEYSFKKYPEIPNIRFLFIGRIIKVKGISELCEAIKIIHKSYSEKKVEFIFCGAKDEEIEVFNELVEMGKINWLGPVDNVSEQLQNSSALIMPSYAEGMSNVMLEAAATGRPVIASNVPGCKEIFVDGKGGYSFSPRNVESLVQSLVDFIELPRDKKSLMGQEARKYVQKNFDRKDIVNEYIKKIEACIKNR